MPVPSETSILSHCSIFITHTNININKLVDNTCCLLEKHLVTNIKLGIVDILPKGKSSSDSNQIFMKSFLYSVGLPQFIVSI